jgi:hypothetical protein
VAALNSTLPVNWDKNIAMMTFILAHNMLSSLGTIVGKTWL